MGGGYYRVDEYDKGGNLLKTTRFMADGKIDYWYIFENDTKGNSVKMVWYKSDGTPT